MATITVGTNSYVTEAELTSYAADRGITISGDTAVLLIKAMDFLETREYKGEPVAYDQALSFPRVFCGAYLDHLQNYNYYDDLCKYDNTVPQKIKDAQCEAAIILDGGDDVQPTIDRTVKREKIDVLEVEYSDNALASKQYTKLNDLLKIFLSSKAYISSVRG